jgi:hypothetical protein
MNLDMIRFGNRFEGVSSMSRCARFSCHFIVASSWAFSSVHHSRAVYCCSRCSWRFGLPPAGDALLTFPMFGGKV